MHDLCGKEYQAAVCGQDGMVGERVICGLIAVVVQVGVVAGSKIGEMIVWQAVSLHHEGAGGSV